MYLVGRRVSTVGKRLLEPDMPTQAVLAFVVKLAESREAIGFLGGLPVSHCRLRAIEPCLKFRQCTGGVCAQDVLQRSEGKTPPVLAIRAPAGRSTNRPSGAGHAVSSPEAMAGWTRRRR
jgi:hypothetical protein